MSRVEHFIRQSWLLVAASFLFGLLMAITNAALSPTIEQNKINKRNRLLGALLPEARDFIPLDTEIEIESLMRKKLKVEIYRAMSKADERVGWGFNAVGPGFADKIELVVAVDADFERIAGFDVLSSNETPGFGDQIKDESFREQFKGAPAKVLKLIGSGKPGQDDSEIVAITGATVSSEAVVEIVSHTVMQVKEQMQKKDIIDNVKEE